MIERVTITRYPRTHGDYWSEPHDDPGWDFVESELKTMDRFEKPILILLKNRDWLDSHLMFVNGGDDTYNISLTEDNDRTLQAYDPLGTDEIVDVWTSDQGFSTKKRFTWSFDDAQAMVRYYFDVGEPHPEFDWQ